MPPQTSRSRARRLPGSGRPCDARARSSGCRRSPPSARCRGSRPHGSPTGWSRAGPGPPGSPRRRTARHGRSWRIRPPGRLPPPRGHPQGVARRLDPGGGRPSTSRAAKASMAARIGRPSPVGIWPRSASRTASGRAGSGRPGWPWRLPVVRDATPPARRRGRPRARAARPARDRPERARGGCRRSAGRRRRSLRSSRPPFGRPCGGPAAATPATRHSVRAGKGRALGGEAVAHEATAPRAREPRRDPGFRPPARSHSPPAAAGPARPPRPSAGPGPRPCRPRGARCATLAAGWDSVHEGGGNSARVRV